MNVCVSSMTEPDNSTTCATALSQYRYAGDVTFVSTGYSYHWYNGVEQYGASRVVRSPRRRWLTLLRT